TIGVTGATGALGGRVAARIARLGLPQRLIVRDSNRAPEYPGSSASMASYEDSSDFERASRGVDTLFVVSAPESENRLAAQPRAHGPLRGQCAFRTGLSRGGHALPRLASRVREPPRHPAERSGRSGQGRGVPDRLPVVPAGRARIDLHFRPYTLLHRSTHQVH